MFESLMDSMSSMNPIIIYSLLLVFPFIENIFPPSPSDFVVVIGGTFIVSEVIGFIPALVLTSIGSEAGFLFLYYLGTQTDRKLAKTGKLKFLSADSVEKAELWFAKFGFFIILFNRFIPGIRSVIAFFSGLSELNFKKTLILSCISAVLWNVILLTLGIIFAENLSKVDYILKTYSQIILLILGLIAVIYVIRYLIKRKRIA